jgi:hypothetical protein
MRVIYRIFIFIVLTGFLFISCNSIKDGRTQRIFYINSYHAGYGSSDDVMEGITETLASENVELKIYFHDAKRKTTVQEIQQSVKNILQEIKQFNPDTDDCFRRQCS